MPRILCQECVFWTGAQEREGNCQRHAPMSYFGIAPSEPEGEKLTQQTIWPKTRSQDGCGEGERGR